MAIKLNSDNNLVLGLSPRFTLMPISLSEAKRKIWEAISNRPPETNVIEYQCDEENFDVLYAVTQIPQIQNKMKSEEFEIRIVPNSSESLAIQRESQLAQYAVIVAARLLSSYTDLTIDRWVQQLYTHSHNAFSLCEANASKVLSQAYPVELLSYDPIAEQLAQKHEARTVEKELQNVVRSDEEKATFEELRQLFEKLTACRAPIGIFIDAVPAFCLVGIIQLALRHPKIDPEMIQSGKSIALDLIDGISKIVPEARKYLEMGFNPEFDEEVE